MKFAEIRDRIKATAGILARAEQVYRSTAADYQKKIDKETKDAQDAVYQAERDAKRRADDERRDLSQKLRAEADALRRITEGVAKWRALLSCCAKVKQEDESDKKSVKAAREFISLIANAEDASTFDLAKIYDVLDSRMRRIEKKMLKNGQKQHIFRMMLLAEKYARDARNRAERELNGAAQERIAHIEEEGEARKKSLKESNEKAAAKRENARGEDLDFIVTSTVQSCVAKLVDEKLTDAVSLKEEYKAHYCAEDGAGMCDNGIFPSEIYLGDAVYPLANMKAGRFASVIANSVPFLVDENDFLSMPLTHSFAGGKSYLFISGATGSHSADVMNDFMFQFCRQLPPGEVEFLVADPARKGLSVKRFLTFKEQFPSAFGDKIYTTESDIAKCLTDLAAYIDNVIQHSLGNKFENVAEYNNKVPDSRLPVKVLCLFELSKCIATASNATLLTDILENAAKCGICVLMDYDEQCVQSSPFNDRQQKRLAELCDAFGTTSEFPIGDGGIFLMQNTMPDERTLERFFTAYAAAAKSNRTKGVVFAAIKPDKLFGMTSAKGLSIPVGKASDSSIEAVEFGKVGSSHHALITGGTGSGKSTLLHTLILSAAENYSPEDLNMYLMDFKSGTEFKVYETHKIPHIKLLALDALQEFGESILADINAEMDSRAVLFKQAGVSDLPGYVAATGRKLPRILIIMDEFQILYSTSRNRKVANECARLTNNIVKLGRSYGVHLVMSTQSLGVLGEDSSLDSSTVEQMRIRIGLKFDDKEAKRLFGEHDADAMRKMRGAIGTAVYNKDFTECENAVFRTAYCDDATKRACLKEIAAATADREYEEMKVFEGSRVPDYPTEKAEVRSGIAIPIGEPIKVDAPLVLNLSRKKTAGIAVIGTRSDMMKQVAALILLGALRGDNVKVHYADGDILVEETPDALTLELLKEREEDAEILSTRADIVRCVDKLYELYRKRRKGEDESSESHVLFVNHTQNVDIVKMMLKGDRVNRDDYVTKAEPVEEKADASEKDEFEIMRAMMERRRGRGASEGEMPPLSACFEELAENGFGFGVYIVVTFDDPAAAVDALGHASIASSMSSKFPNKIVFGVGDDQCGKIVTDLSSSPTNDVVAVYTNSVAASRQFKPYKLPDREKMIELIKKEENNGRNIELE